MTNKMALFTRTAHWTSADRERLGILLDEALQVAQKTGPPAVAALEAVLCAFRDGDLEAFFEASRDVFLLELNCADS